MPECPACGEDLRGRPETGRCPRCDLPYDATAFSIDGVRDEGEALVVITLIWAGAIVTALALSLAWLAGSLGAVMAAHLHHCARSGLGRRRLIVSSRGVALVQGSRLARYSRWHLFDEARLAPRRLETTPGAGQDPGRWKLTLVNAYKPSISTYLHSRGTDAPIFTPCLEFEFAAPRATAEAARRRMQRDIDAARRSYRALGIREMDLEPIDVDALLELHECPECRRDLTAEPRRGRCPACGFHLEPSMFIVDATALGIRRGLAAAWINALGGGPAPEPRLLVTAGGVAELMPGSPPRRFDFSTVRELRTVRLQSGHRRLALWTEPKATIDYSPLLFRWHSRPGGGPALDLLLKGDPREAEIVSREIVRRFRQHAAAHADAER